MTNIQVTTRNIKATKVLKIQKEANGKLIISSPYFNHKWKLRKKYKTEMNLIKKDTYSGFNAYIKTYNSEMSIAKIAEEIYRKDFAIVYGEVIIPAGSKIIVNLYNGQIVSNQMIIKRICIKELETIPEIEEKDIFALLKQAIKFTTIIKNIESKYFIE